MVLLSFYKCRLSGGHTLGCVCFPEFFQNFSERQILWSLCLVDFLPLTLKLPIQTSLSVVPNSQFVYVHVKNVKISGKQVCIPVGCVPPTCCPYLPACTAQGGVCSGVGTVCSQGGICFVGCIQHTLRQTPPPELNEWQIGVKTYPSQTSFAGSNKHTPEVVLEPKLYLL